MRQPSSDRQIGAINVVAMIQHGLILLMVGPLVPSLIATFHIRESTAGILLGLGSLGFMAGPLVAGALIDRVSVRIALVVGLSIEVIGLVLFGTSGLFVVAAVSNVVLHFGASFIETSVNVMPTLRRRRGSAHAAMNLVHMFFSIGAFAGPFLIGVYLNATGAWRPIFFFSIVPTAALLVWAFSIRLPPRVSGHTQPSPFAKLGAVLRLRHVLLGSLALFFYVGAEVGISSWVVYYLERRLGFSTVASTSGLSILWLAIMAGRFSNSVLGNRFSSASLVTVSGIVGALGAVAFLFARSIVPAYALLTLIGLCLSGVFPNVMAELNARDPEKTGTVTAVMAIGASFGSTVFQWAVGALAQAYSLTVAFVLPAVLQVLLVIAFLSATRRPSAGPAPAAQ